MLKSVSEDFTEDSFRITIHDAIANYVEHKFMQIYFEFKFVNIKPPIIFNM